MFTLRKGGGRWEGGETAAAAAAAAAAAGLQGYGRRRLFMGNFPTPSHGPRRERERNNFFLSALGRR